MMDSQSGNAVWSGSECLNKDYGIVLRLFNGEISLGSSPSYWLSSSIHPSIKT